MACLFIHWLEFIQLWIKISDDLILQTTKQGLPQVTEIQGTEMETP